MQRRHALTAAKLQARRPFDAEYFIKFGYVVFGKPRVLRHLIDLLVVGVHVVKLSVVMVVTNICPEIVIYAFVFDRERRLYVFFDLVDDGAGRKERLFALQQADREVKVQVGVIEYFLYRLGKTFDRLVVQFEFEVAESDGFVRGDVAAVPG